MKKTEKIHLAKKKKYKKKLNLYIFLLWRSFYQTQCATKRISFRPWSFDCKN
jgi:hypothetical protein